MPLKPRSWTHYFVLMGILILFLAFVMYRMQKLEPLAQVADLNAKMRSLFDEGKYAEAEPLSKSQLSLLESKYGPNDSRLIPPIIWVATLHQKQDHLDQAEPLFRRALQIREKESGPDDPRLLYVLNSIAEVQLAGKHLPEAEETCLRALDLRKKIAGVIPLELARSMRVMGDILMAKEKPAEAEHYYKESIAHYEAHSAPRDAVDLMEKLAEYYRKNNRLGEADKLMERVYEIRVGHR